MTLTFPKIDAAAVERRFRELLNEFARRWFDGLTHPAPVEEFVFPSCAVGWGQTWPKDELPLIHFMPGEIKPARRWVPEGIRVSGKVTLNTTVRVVNAGRDGNAADHLAVNIADLLHLLFATPVLRAPLAQKGILHPRVLRSPIPNAFPGYQNRFMVLGCTLDYLIAG